MKIAMTMIFRTLLRVCLILVYFAPYAEAVVVKQDSKVYLLDRTGERWDITQAVSIGFDPNHFEFGIGRNAFNPLDDTHWQPSSKQKDSRMRIIGIAGEGEAHAYSDE